MMNDEWSGGDDRRGGDYDVPSELEIYSSTGHGLPRPESSPANPPDAQSIDATARTLKELFGI